MWTVDPSACEKLLHAGLRHRQPGVERLGAGAGRGFELERGHAAAEVDADDKPLETLTCHRRGDSANRTTDLSGHVLDRTDRDRHRVAVGVERVALAAAEALD